MGLDCYNLAADYTPATTATALTDQTKASGTPATGDVVEVTWESGDEGSGHVITVYTDGTITDGGSVSGKVGTPIRLESGTTCPALVQVRGAARVHVASSTAFTPAGTVSVRLGLL